MSTADGLGFDRLCTLQGVPRPLPEYRFARHIGREWRFDWCWPDQKLALEVEGGVFAKIPGRHSRGAGYREDLEKYNTALVLGWRVLRVLPEQLKRGDAIALVKRALEAR